MQREAAATLRCRDWFGSGPRVGHERDHTGGLGAGCESGTYLALAGRISSR
jgi:hypothetical protein